MLQLRLGAAAALLWGALAAPALAWIDTGHMLTSEIAWPRLRPQAQKEIERLLAIGGTERTADFWTASAWADDTRTEANGNWHFTNLFFRTDGKPVQNQPLPENVVWAIRRFERELADRSLPDAQRADALRFLIHFVGDAHQPLHTTARESDRFPKGDRGGNDFLIEPPASMQGLNRPPRNLHALWDLGCGWLPRLSRPLQPEQRATLARLAQEALATLPSAEYRDETDLNPDHWAKEGFVLSQRVVYHTIEGSAPTEAYLATGRLVSKQRLALAGLRLSRILNAALAP